jgi:hypothetical protein
VRKLSPLAVVLCLVAVAACKSGSNSGSSTPTPTSPSTPATPSSPSTPAVAAALSALGLSGELYVGDGTVDGTVTLTAAAPTGGVVVTLASDSSAGSVPASVTVPAGSTTIGFQVRTFAPAGARLVTITGGYSGVTKTISLTVYPPMNLTGRWTGRLTCIPGSPCGTTAHDSVINITQTGSSFTGNCQIGTGAATTALTLSISQSFPATGTYYLLGSCSGGSLDVSYKIAPNTANIIWKTDFSGVFSR